MGDEKPARWGDLVDHPAGIETLRVAPGVLRLHERVVAAEERAYFYLLEGDEGDVLIDGGWGFARSLEGIRRDPSKPLQAIATHSHVDHVGLLHLAGRLWGHAAEAAVFADPDPLATQALPWLDGRPILADGRSIDPATIRQQPCALHATLADGDVIDIGGRVLEVIHTPGHSPGSIALLDRTAGLLFCADTVHDGDILDDLPGSDATALLLSQERLANVDFVLALPGHGAILSPEALRSHFARHGRLRGRS